MHRGVFSRCVDVVVCDEVWCVCGEVHGEWMLVQGRTSRLLGRRFWVGGTLVGARIDCCYTHTGLRKVTDAGMKDFSAALGSSSTITTVELNCKSEVVGVMFV